MRGHLFDWFLYVGFMVLLVLTMFTRSWVASVCLILLGLELVLRACWNAKREVLDDRNHSAEQARRDYYRRMRRD